MFYIFISVIEIDMYRTVDLFAGIGGIRLGFENAGFQTVYANDQNEKCKVTYDLNFDSTELTVKDITKPTGDNYTSVLDDVKQLDFDVLLGGFPCQAFSIAGYREGFRDSKGRGDLFFYMAEIIEQTQPQAFLLENVKNLKSHDKGRTYDIISSTLHDLGYSVDSKILNSMNYGNVPQTRERIFIVGFRNPDAFTNFNFPDPIERDREIADLLLPPDVVDDYYYYEDKPLWEKISDYPFKMDTVYQYRRVYVRENKSGVCPTLTANMGTGGHNVPIVRDARGVRKITPQECLRFQGFPETYQLPDDLAKGHLYQQAGNSVTVTVVERIAAQMKIALDSQNVLKSTTQIAS